MMKHTCLTGLLFLLLIAPAIAFGTQLQQFSVKISEEDSLSKLQGTGKLGGIPVLEGDYEVTATLDGAIVNSVTINAEFPTAAVGTADSPEGRLVASWNENQARITVMYAITGISVMEPHNLRVSIVNDNEELLAGSGTATLQSNLYDDFDSLNFIDESKWSFGTSPEPACVIGVLEQRALITELTSVGQNVACWLKFINPAVITGWSTDVTVSRYMHTQGRSDARIFGLFFRATLRDRKTGSLIGTADIHGQVRVRNVEPDELEPELLVGFAEWLIFFCEDQIFCGFGKVLSIGTLGDVRLNETRNIAIDWDGQTTFTLKLSGVPSATVNLANLAQFVVTNIGPPNRQNKAVGSRATSNPTGEMTAIYDNVRCHTADGSPCPLF